jgi:hypothetical protein
VLLDAEGWHDANPNKGIVWGLPPPESLIDRTPPPFLCDQLTAMTQDCPAPTLALLVQFRGTKGVEVDISSAADENCVVLQ